MYKKSDQGPRLSVEISEQEKAAATRVKTEFARLLKELDDALKVIYDLRDAVVQERPSKEDLKVKYRGRLLRYKRKIILEFNQFLTKLKTTLELIVQISDPDMVRLREIIIAEFDELSDGVESIIDLLKDADREGFTKSLERITTQLDQRRSSIKDIVDNQLFNHIEQDILGRMKISELKHRIRVRARKLQKLTMGLN